MTCTDCAHRLEDIFDFKLRVICFFLTKDTEEENKSGSGSDQGLQIIYFLLTKIAVQL